VPRQLVVRTVLPPSPLHLHMIQRMVRGPAVSSGCGAALVHPHSMCSGSPHQLTASRKVFDIQA
jgi:hypothetical protein